MNPNVSRIFSGRMTSVRVAPAAACLQRSLCLCRAFVCAKIVVSRCAVLLASAQGVGPVLTAAASPSVLTCGRASFSPSRLRSGRSFVMTPVQAVGLVTTALLLRCFTLSELA